MRKIYPIILILINVLPVFAQDTLKTQDLPNADSTYVLSIGTAFTGMDVVSTGANYNWNYSQLGRSSQRVDTMFKTADTDPLLSFFFINSQFNSNRANHATNGANFNLGTVNVSDVFNYYYNSTSDYRQPGFGAVVNGIPIPIAYSPHDILYKFPLKFNDEDSVSYSYELDLTTTVGLYFKVKRSRHNLVDGWGSLTTPYGTFDVVRVKSVLVERDSMYVDTFNLGVNLPAVTTIEYKWLGKGFGLPLLQVNTNATNVVNQILYQDSVHLTGISDFHSLIQEPVVFPNPASENVIIRYSLLKNADVKISLFSSEGKLILNQPGENQSAGMNVKIINLSEYELSAGNYFIKLTAENTVQTIPLLIKK